jgi:hypothetical protein
MQAALEHPHAARDAKPPDGVRRMFGLVGLVAAALAIPVGVFHPAQFFHAYLFAALACLNSALGCLALVFIHRMTGGSWGQTLAPALSAGLRMIPCTLLFFLPLFFGLRHLFPWAAPGPLGAQAQALLAKHPFYFSRPVFVLRSVCYAVLFLIVLWMARGKRRAPWTGPAGMIGYMLAAYLLSVDWVLSLEPGWHSTGFPLVFMASQALSALTLCIAVVILAGPPGGAEDQPAVWKDLANLLLGALMFWAYVSYSQFLVVWSGNLPDQAVWYLHRNAGGWHYLLVALAVFQLFIPVLLLLSSRTKRRTLFFAALAGEVLVCQIVYLYWLILPSFRPRGIGFHWLDALLLLALGGLWLFGFLGLKPAAGKEAAGV